MKKVGGREGILVQWRPGDEESAVWQCWGNAFQVEGIAGAKALRQPPTGHAPEMQSMVSVAE